MTRVRSVIINFLVAVRKEWVQKHDSLKVWNEKQTSPWPVMPKEKAQPASIDPHISVIQRYNCPKQ